MERLWKSALNEVARLSLHQRIYTILISFVVLITLLVTVAFYSLSKQAAYREEVDLSSRAALNTERVNALIYAIVMESRGIYMSTDKTIVSRYATALLRLDRELARIVSEWQQIVRQDDAEQFATFKKRIEQFSGFRQELVRRALEINSAAGREWGDNDANRSVRSALNEDLETLARVYNARAQHAAMLGEQNSLASWMLILFGIGATALAALVVVMIRNSILRPLTEISHVTDKIAAGKNKLEIPHITRTDEIGQMARAVQNFQHATNRILELEESEIAAGKQRDLMEDKYHTKKWQLGAAIGNMPQGLIMLDAAANVLVVNEQYRKMYDLPRDVVKSGCSLRDILQHRAKIGLFAGDIDEYLAAILARIAKREPSISDVKLVNGRIIRISERPMDGGGWVATHEDYTEQLQVQRMLERTERFLATVIENVHEAIVAKDARNLQYVFANRAAEVLYGLPRSQIIGKTARDIFPDRTADWIERHDRQLLAENREMLVGAHTIETPGNGTRVVEIRRLPIKDRDQESHFLLSMMDDQTDRVPPARAF